MNFDDLPPDYLRELVKWSPDFRRVCHLISKTIYLTTKLVKLEYCKDIGPKRVEFERYMRRQTHPFGYALFSAYTNLFFTSKLWKTTRRNANGQSFDVKGFFYQPEQDYINVSTVKSDCTYDKICFDRSSLYFQGLYTTKRKHIKDETLGKLVQLKSGKDSYMDCKAIPMLTLFEAGTCFDCQTVFNILSARKSFPLELCREQTSKYFDSCLQKFKTPLHQFIYVYINHLLLGLDSIHNQFTCFGNIKGKLDSLNLADMIKQVHQTINELV